MKAEKDKTSLQNNIFYNTLGSIVYQGALWLITLVCLSISGLENGGILSLAMATTNVLFTIAIYGMRAFEASDIKGKYSDKDYIVSRFFTCAVALILCVAVSMGEDTQTFWCISLYMLFRISEAFMDVLHGIDQRVMRMDIVGKSFILRGVFSLLVFGGVLFISKSLNLAVLLMAVASFAIVIFYDVPYTKTFGDFTRKASFKNILKLLGECFPLVVYAFLNTVISTLPRMMIENVYGAKALAIFTAIAAPAVVIQLGATYVFTPLISGIANAYVSRDKISFNKILIRVCVVMLFIGIIGIIGGFVFGDWGLSILYSAKKEVFDGVMENSKLLVPVIISAIITAYVLFFNMLLTIIRDFKGLVISNILGIVFCSVTGPFFIENYYLQGANLLLILSLLVQLLGLCVFAAFKCHKHFKTAENSQ